MADTDINRIARMTVLAILAVVVLFGGLVVAVNPHIRCKVTFGTWMPAYMVTTGTTSSGFPTSEARPAFCRY